MASMTTESGLGVGGSEAERWVCRGCSRCDRFSGAFAEAARISAFLPGTVDAGAELEGAAPPAAAVLALCCGGSAAGALLADRT
eukprot:15469159-Alexandrium_andersonii.AAC.1